MEEKLVTILNEMAEYLSIAQMKKLQEVLLKNLAENEPQKAEISNAEYLQMFLDAKKIEGCSERTLQYYRVTVERMLQSITTPIRKICTEEIRSYLSGYQQINGCGKVTVDNIRRNISSFFSWLEEEDYILKSPMRRIHKIKTKQQVKETISDEAIEQLRDHCACARDLAMIDLLYSTGIRVGELVNLNIDDVNFEARECVVFGNGANIKQGVADGGFPITRIETIANDKFNRDRMGYAGITDTNKYQSYILEDGDLLMSHINSVQYLGRVVLYHKQGNEKIIHGKMIRE